MSLLAPVLTLHATGAAPPAQVWRRYASLDRWPDWSPLIGGVDADERRLRPGLRGVVHGPLGVPVPFVVTDVDAAAMRWTWRARVGPFALTIDHGVDAAGEGTRTWLRVRGLLPAVLGYAPLAQLALQRLVRP